MLGVLIKLIKGHDIEGEGEGLGIDSTGKQHTFWRSYGHMEVPSDLAIKLLKEQPQRYELVDKKAMNILKIDDSPEEETKLQDSSEEPDKEELKEEIVPKSPKPKAGPEDELSLKKLNDRKTVKDWINDWAAKNGYDLNPSKQSKSSMISSLVKQIKDRTGKKIN